MEKMYKWDYLPCDLGNGIRLHSYIVLASSVEEARSKLDRIFEESVKVITNKWAKFEEDGNKPPISLAQAIDKYRGDFYDAVDEPEVLTEFLIPNMYAQA